MKLVFTEYDQSARIQVKGYGFEEISCNARWGRGSRDAYIVHYIISGEGYFNGHSVKSGQGFLITPDMMHEYHSSEARPWQYFWIVFSGEDAAGICQKYIDTDERNLFEFRRFEFKIIDLINRIMRCGGQLTEARALGYFYMLLSCHEPAIDVSGNDYVTQAQKYMKTHIYRTITITEVAQALGINDRYLYNLFIKHLHISPKQYLNNLKMDYAQTLLETTSNSISEIAISAGFRDVLTFSRFFKDHIGVSPTDYRNGHKTAL